MSDNPYRGVRRLFIFASGARPDILRSCPTEETAYATLGGTVLTTAALAAVSMTFALNMALRLPLAACLALGVAWGLAILNLDRWLITSTRRTKGWIGQIINALPRLALAVLLGFVISEPLVLAIFEPEISDEIELARQEELREERIRQDEGPDAARIASNKAEIAQLQAEDVSIATADSTAAAGAIEAEIGVLRGEIAQLQAEIREAERAWLDAVADANEELQAGDVSGRGPGAGENYELKLDKANSLEVVADEVRAQNEASVAEHQARIASLQGDLDRDRLALAEEEQARNEQARARRDAIAVEIARLTADNAEIQARLDNAVAALEVETQEPGLVAQIEALESLSRRSPAIGRAHVLLAALFIFIDVLPVLGKLLQLLVKPRPYELTVDAVDRRAKLNSEIFVATAERERDDQIRQLHLEADLRAQIEDENRRHFLDRAGALQQRLGDERLRAWELEHLPEAVADPMTPQVEPAPHRRTGLVETAEQR